jgi:hypothetical protein
MRIARLLLVATWQAIQPMRRVSRLVHHIFPRSVVACAVVHAGFMPGAFIWV